MLANASKITATGLGLFGDQKDTDINRATRWMGFVGSTMGTIGSAFAWSASSADKEYRREITKWTGELANATDKNNKEEKDVKAKLSQNVKNADWNTYKADEKRLNSIKAKKYAMKQASEMNSIRANQSTKGIAGTIGGVASCVGSLFNAIPSWADTGFGQFTKAAGGAIGALTTITKQYERVSDLKAQSAIKKKKESLVNEYIQDKMSKLDKDLEKFRPQHPEIKNITDDEKKRIVIGRLGVNIDIDDKPPGKEDMKNAFDIINHKRALQIMNSEDTVKNSLLDLLYLDRDASLEEIESVLRGD